MPTLRFRLVRTLALALVTWLALHAFHARAATVQAVSSTNQLILLNPRTISTNVFVVGDGGSINDGTAAIWTYNASSSAGQTADILKPTLYNGRWYRNLSGGGGGGGGDSLWTNISSVLQPADLSLQPMTSFGWFVGPNSQTWWGGPLSDDAAFVSFRDKTLGETDNNEIDIGAGDPGSTDNGVFRAYAGSATTGIQLTRSNQVFNVTFNASQTAVNIAEAGVTGWLANPSADGSTPGEAAHVFNTYTTFTDADLAHYQNNGTNVLSVLPNGGLAFGPGITNVLYRVPTSQALRYTNSATTTASVNIEVQNGSGANTGITVIDGVGGLQTTEAILGLTAGGRTASLDESAEAFRPTNAGELSLGRSDVPWNELFLSGTTYGASAIFTSPYADNATNVALVIKSSTDWTLGKWLSIESGTNTVLTYGPASDLYGAPATTLNSGRGLWIQTASTAEENGSGGALVLTTGNGQGTGDGGTVEISTGAGVNGGSIVTYLGTGLTANGKFRVDTGGEFTSGGIFEVGNNGTDKFAVAFSGATTIARAAAEPAAPAAGYFTLFAVDNGSGKMLLKVRFPTGASQLLATEP